MDDCNSGRINRYFKKVSMRTNVYLGSLPFCLVVNLSDLVLIDIPIPDNIIVY